MSRSAPATEPLSQQVQFRRALDRLRYVGSQSAFFRDLYQQAGVDVDGVRSLDDFMAVPMVDKSLIMADQEAHPPFGTQLIGDVDALSRVFCTGGTLLLGLNAADLEQLELMFAEMFTIAGVQPEDLVDIASTFHWAMGGSVMDAGFRRLGAAVLPAGPGASDRRLVMLGRLKISVLQAFTPYAEELASRFAEAGIVPARDLAVRRLIIGGELRTADAKVRLAEAWAGAEIRETYGASEVGLAAIECDVGDGMHVSEDCYLEVVDPDTGYQVPPDTPGEIVLTDLFRSAQPFVRYRTGDLTEGLSLVPCGCGRTTPRLGRIVGRRSDVLRVRGLFLSPSVVRAALAEFPEITTWRIVVDRPGNIDEVWLTVESSDAQPVSDDFDARLGKTLKGQTDLSIQIRHVPTGTIGEAPWYDDRRSF